MTPEETALILTLASGVVASVITEAVRLLPKGKRMRQRTVQPLALALSVAGVLGYHALQPGALDWSAVLPQVAGAWLIAGSVARVRKPKVTPPHP